MILLIAHRLDHWTRIDNYHTLIRLTFYHEFTSRKVSLEHCSTAPYFILSRCLSVQSRTKMNVFNYLLLSLIQRLDCSNEVSTQIRNVDQDRCKEVPFFPYPAENIDCMGFVGYGEICAHKCGDTVIESTCEKVMIDLGKEN